jgi:hypothetical protein
VADIRVTKAGDTGERLSFDVDVTDAGGSSHHEVTLARSDWERQSGRYTEPEEFVRRCFEFLLEREPKESILRRFDVREIGTYFPEFVRDVLHPED